MSSTIGVLILAELAILIMMTMCPKCADTTSMRYSIVNKDYEDYEDECPCQNGGNCVLENDFCACPSQFTGRHCELNIVVDSLMGCGRLLNNEEEYTECAKCTCSRNILTCVALSVSTCNLKLFVEPKSDRVLIENLKGSNLIMLLNLMNSIENYAYQYYINLYRSRHGYNVVYMNIDVASSMLLQQLSNSNQLVVYTSGNGRLLGIYFRHQAPRTVANSVDDSYSSINNFSNRSLTPNRNMLIFVLFLILL